VEIVLVGEILKHIRAIRGFGIFADYAHPGAAAVPDFQRYNVFYGWNGTGKTTLMRDVSGAVTTSVAFADMVSRPSFTLD
jgi:wobble nucleotide-excising tRNase